MITWIRKASKPILWLIVVIVVVAFAFWGDFTPTGNVSRNVVGRIDGVPVDAKTYQSALREATLGFFLAEGRTPGLGSDGETLVQDRAWNRLLLLNEADKLKINVTNEEVERAITQFTPFVVEGNFNPVVFDRFRQGLLPSLGISYRDFEGMMRNDIRIQRAIDAITLGVNVDESSVEDQIMRDFGINTIQILTLPIDPQAQEIVVTDEILRPIYDSRSSQLLSPEKRNFIVAEFPFEKDNPTSQLDARDKAVNFTVALLDDEGNVVEDFTGVAQKSGISVKQLNSVSQETEEDENSDLAIILEEGFKLSNEIKDSNAIKGSSSYYVVRLVSIEDRTTIPYEQARAQLEEEYRKQQALSRGFSAARQIREEIIAELESGTDIVTVANNRGISTELIEKFVSSEAMGTGDNDQFRLANTVPSLPVGQLSQPQSFRDGVAFFYVIARKAPEDTAGVRSQIQQRLFQQAKNNNLSEWLAATQRGNTELTVRNP